MTPPPGPAKAPRAALLTLYAHPFELATLIVLGVSALRSGLDPSELAGILADPLIYLWAIANAVGILAVVFGLFASADITGERPRLTAAGRAAEKAGLYLIAGTMAGYVVVIESALPWGDSWPSSVQLAAVAAAAVLRALAIRKAERIELEQTRARVRSVLAEEASDG